jgi:hypothetical protein
MQIVDAVIEVAEAEFPDHWRRYCEIACLILFNVPAADAPREMLRTQLQGRSYASPSHKEIYADASEADQLAEIFLDRLVARVHAGRYTVRGVAPGKLGREAIDPALITAETFKGDPGKLANGTVVYAIDVVAGPVPALAATASGAAQMDNPSSVETNMPPSLPSSPEPSPPEPSSPEPKDATHEEIHIEIDANNKARAKAGLRALNKKAICKPVQEQLAAKRLKAPQGLITDLAGDDRYKGLRAKQGRPRKKSKPS